MELDPNSLLGKVAAFINEDTEKSRMRRLHVAAAIVAAHTNLLANGVENVPELTEYAARNGFEVEVKDPEQWGKIHKAVGELQLYGKTALGNDARNKNVKVSMHPKQDGLQYNVTFSYIKKLDKTDKCKVKSVVRKSTTVVCEV